MKKATNMSWISNGMVLTWRAIITSMNAWLFGNLFKLYFKFYFNDFWVRLRPTLQENTLWKWYFYFCSKLLTTAKTYSLIQTFSSILRKFKKLRLESPNFSSVWLRILVNFRIYPATDFFTSRYWKIIL